MKRVVIFRSQLLGLSETFIRDQASALRHWEPVLMGEHQVENGLPTPGVMRSIIAHTGHAYLHSLRFWLSLPKPALLEKIKQSQAVLVHAHFGTDAVDIWPSVKAAGIPMVVTLHGYDINTHREWWEAGWAGKRRRLYPRRLLQMARHPSVHFIAVSKAIRQKAIAYGIPTEKLTVCYTGVDTERFRPNGIPLSQRRKQILFVGRMVENKGPLLLVCAFAQLRKQEPEAELVMIGDGPLLPEVTQLAADLAVPVSLLGPRQPEEVIFHMNESRALCLPSMVIPRGSSEGMGQVLLEAQACGVPVVGANVGGIPEAIIDGVTGRLFAPGDVSALKEALRAIIQDTDKHPEILSAACRKHVLDNFNVRERAQEIENTYNSHLLRHSFRHQALKFSSADYWDHRYHNGGNSGPGSYGHLAMFKAGVLNRFVAEKKVDSVIEFGCGDGNQLTLSRYSSYVGYDVSEIAVSTCRRLFSGDSSKQFFLSADYDNRKCDMALSLDVIFHLVEDSTFDAYMHRLFAAANTYVVIYSSNEELHDGSTPPHVRHRNFTQWVEENIDTSWVLREKVPNKYPYDGDYTSTSFSDFYIYERLASR